MEKANACENEHAPNRGRPLVIREVLDRVPFGKSWIYAAMKDGRFPKGQRIGRRRFWWEHDVDRAIRESAKPV